MKKQVLKVALLVVGVICSLTTLMAQTRYVDDVFTSVSKTANVVYNTNRSMNILFNSGYPDSTANYSPFLTVDLKCDIYSPAGDSNVLRPAIILLHTGSYIPAIANKQATGSRTDSSIVELATRLAKKGYVAVAASYRMGWRATSTQQEILTEDLIKATYRGIQDARNCIRFLRKNATTYGIDPTKIVVGGQATGGYIALALGSVDKIEEIESNIKFLRGDLSPMVSVDTLGNWKGLGGLPYFNISADTTVSGDANMVFHYGGAMGDSSWMESNSLPVVGIQVVSDLFAPFYTGDVRIPTGQTVIPSASGAGVVIPMANSLGVNDKINAATFTDVYTTRAMAASGNVKNLFPIFPKYPLDGAPWEWWDTTIIQNTNLAMFYNYPLPANGRAADSLSRFTNPFMSAATAKAYIDTIVNFVTPRIAVQLDLANFTGVKENTNISKHLSVFPNPANDVLHINLDGVAGQISSFSIIDITGRVLLNGNSNSNYLNINVSELKTGMYFVQIMLNDGNSVTKRILIK